MVMAPVMEQVAKEYADKVKVVGAAIGEAGDTASELGIMAIPALVFFKDGKEVHRIVGPVRREKLVDAIRNKLGA